jgi:hypothetical protein
VPFDEGTDIAKLTEALVAKKYTGDMEGTSTTKWLMAYAPDKTASFIGLERIKGAIGGKTGQLGAATRENVSGRIGVSPRLEMMARAHRPLQRE